MKRAFTIVEMMIVVAIVAIIAAMIIPLCCKKEEPKDVFEMDKGTRKQSAVQVEVQEYENIAGQHVAILDGNESLGPWLATHKDCEIIGITGVARSGSSFNPTDGFIIVYRRAAAK